MQGSKLLTVSSEIDLIIIIVFLHWVAREKMKVEWVPRVEIPASQQLLRILRHQTTKKQSKKKLFL